MDASALHGCKLRNPEAMPMGGLSGIRHAGIEVRTDQSPAVSPCNETGERSRVVAWSPVAEGCSRRVKEILAVEEGNGSLEKWLGGHTSTQAGARKR
jgi:hypothetical protein